MYTLYIPVRLVIGMLGTGYPALKMADYQHIRFFENVFAFLTKDQVSVSIDGIHRRRYGLFNIDHYKVNITNSGKDQYKKAIAIEKFVREAKPLSFFSPPRFWNKFFRSRHPENLFMVNEIMPYELYEWLDKNVPRSQYQMFSKFGGDMTLALAQDEHATMFKLTFAEHV